LYGELCSAVSLNDFFYAERWEHLADAEIANHFRECNLSNSLGSDLAA
jgi:hypothetical protein